jgi:hypothetical protein
MAVAVGRDTLLFGIHPRRLAGIPKVVGTLVSTVGKGACGERARNLPKYRIRVGTRLDVEPKSRAITHFVEAERLGIRADLAWRSGYP